MRTTTTATTAVLAALSLVVAACTGSTSAAPGEAPLPTIGLGSDVSDDGSDQSNGQASGAADVRAIGSSTIDSVVMIGDSITVGSTTALEDAFGELGFTNIVIEAQNGKRMAVNRSDNTSGAGVAKFLVVTAEDVDPDDVDPDDFVLDNDHTNELWIVALGTNDVDQYDDASEVAAAVNEVLVAVPDDVLLIWVDTYFGLRLEGAALMNMIIEDRLDRRGNATIARWSDAAEGDGVLQNDGVHPRDKGTLVFAETVKNTIIDFLQLA